LREHRDAARILEAVAKTTCSNGFKNSGIACRERVGRSARWLVDREADRAVDWEADRVADRAVDREADRVADLEELEDR
jgi:hypothetical protein